MKFYKQLLAIIFVCFIQFSFFYPFDVKVLLKKWYKNSDEFSDVQLSSKEGFIVSESSSYVSGKRLSDTIVNISYQNQFFINGIAYGQGPLYLVPDLTEKERTFFKQYVSDFIENSIKVTDNQTSLLHNFFDQLILQKKKDVSVDYHVLDLYMQDNIKSFLEHIVNQLGNNPVVSLQTLQNYAETFLSHRIKTSFLEQLALQKLVKKDRKLLQQDKEHRYEFFTRQVVSVLHLLLEDFIISLPRNILSQIVKKDVGMIAIDGCSYLGALALLQEGQKVYLVNTVDIDDYILSVIRHEGWPGWPLEVNKVLAIVCRTYLVWQVLQAQKVKRPYHIENGIRHQTYKGHHKYERLKDAVFQTRDVCIAYNNKPILAMFDSCCGGVAPKSIHNPEYARYPYLNRLDSCTFCKSCKIFSWKAEFSHDALVTILQKEIPDLVTIDDIQVIKKDDAGLVQKVGIWSKGSMTELTGKKIYSLFSKVKSFSFDIDVFPKKELQKKKKKQRKQIKKVEDALVESVEKKFIIHGKGYGHHMGLCQWGAMKLVKDYHWNYQRIISFYYPGTNLIKLQYQR